MTTQAELQKIIARRNARLEPKTTNRRLSSSSLYGQLGQASKQTIDAVNRVLNVSTIAPKVGIVEQMRREMYAKIK